jgi:hypothetical protein
MKPMKWAMLAAIALSAAPVFGQGGGTVVQDKQVVVSKQVADSRQLADKITVELAQQMKLSVMGHVTKGAPYSADATNESVQTLADGNRIATRSTTKVYRDSEGRTRTEQTEPNGTQVVSISDPVSGTTYMLYPQTHTAYQNDAVIVSWTTGEGAVRPHVTAGASTTVIQRLDAEKKAAAGAAEKGATIGYTIVEGVAAPGGATVAFSQARRPDARNVTREELGDQVVEGVTATGTRTTTVIAAGEIGNEQPIRIVSEQWLCKDLGILVMTKYSDPRSGETTYRVTNISRAEPDPSLFQVPSDYSMQASKIKRESR